MIRTEVRGEDATGIYQVHEDGDWMMTKKGVKSSQWVFLNRGEHDQVVYKDFMETWGNHESEMTALVGHCRKATVGSRGGDNADNHPFAIQLDQDHALLGIHNGTLHNHEVIHDKLPPGLTRQGSTDSEIIFHFLYHMTEQGKKPITGEVLKEIGRRLDGAFACIMVNSRFPNIVGTFREGRPMEYFMIAPLNVVLIVSEKRFAEAAFAKYKFVKEFLDPELPDLQYEDRTLAERDWRVFDTSLEFPEGKPTFQDLNKISENGAIRTTAEKVPADWMKPATTTTSTTSSSTSKSTTTGSKTTSSTGTGTSKTSGAKTSTASSGNTTAAATARASKKDEKVTAKQADDDVIDVEGEIVELELGEVVPAKSLERVKSLGICTHYDSVKEIDYNLGIDGGKSVTDMDPVELANRVAQLHFAMGYATSNFDNKSDREEFRRKSRDVMPKLEKAELKKQKAENHIWELKQLLVLFMSLAGEGYDLDTKNLAIALSAFPEINVARKKDIMQMAKQVFEDKGAQRLMRKLREKYKEAEQRENRRAEAASAE
jgi:hypothetical protein